MASKLPAAQPDGTPKLLNGAHPRSLDEETGSTGMELVAPKPPLQAHTGSAQNPTDEEGSIAGVFLAGPYAFKISAEDPEEPPYGARNTHAAVATNNAARVSTQTEEPSNPRGASGTDASEPDGPNASRASSAKASQSHKALPKGNGSLSRGIPEKQHNDVRDTVPTMTAHYASDTEADPFTGTDPDGAGANRQLPTSVDGGIVSYLGVNDYYAAIILLASIALLAVLPSGGPVRHDHSERGSDPASDLGEGTDDAEVELIARNTGDSELGATGRLAAPSAERRSAVWLAVTSSKVMFVLNFVLWVSLAMGFSAYGKGYLRDTREPIGLVVLQGLTGIVVLGALGRLQKLDMYPQEGYTPAAARRVVFAASMHTGQSLLTNFAVLLGGVAATNALKAMEPIAAAAFSYFLLGKSCSGARLASIVVIAAGIVVFTATSSVGPKQGAGARGEEGGAEEGGFSNRAIVGISTTIVVAAVCCNALRNVFIKKGDPIPPHQTLFACSVVAAILGIGMKFLKMSFRVMDDLSYVGVAGGGHTEYNTDPGDGSGGSFYWIKVTGINASLCFVGYNFASFNLLARLTPVGHAVGNSFKRVLVFAGGLLFLGEFMNARQLGGAALALAGVLAYNVSGAQSK